MIYVGEVEFTEKSMYPDGHTGHLFVGTSIKSIADGRATLNYHYAISPVPYKKAYHVGDMFITEKNLSVTEFLQSVVDMDIQIGRGVVQKFPDTAKVRLKGMTEWIQRQDIDSVIDEKINR